MAFAPPLGLCGVQGPEFDMTIETYLLYLAALVVFFATPPDTSQVLIIAKSAQHGFKERLDDCRATPP